MILKKKWFLVLIFSLILLTFLKIDFRFVNGIYCCSDDFDYYIHAETISEDLDLNYSNQLKGIEDKRYYQNGKPAPIGYVGSGILAAPFMALGNIFDYLRLRLFDSNNLMNYKLLIYSFSPIFYLLFSISLIFKSLNLLKISFKYYHFLILFLGSGASYYAFERFSMTHAYEIFATSLVLYFSTNYFVEDKNPSRYAFLIPVSILIGFTVRWTNYYLILLPLFIKLLLRTRKKLIYEKSFILSSIFSFSIFLYLAYKIYGVLTIDPRTAYQVNNSVANIININVNGNLVVTYIDRVTNIFYTQEFGIIYFMPALSFSVLLAISYLFKNYFESREVKYLEIIYLLACFQVIFIVAMWRSTASAYTFRYLLALYPISIIYYFYIKDKYNFENLHKIILLLSGLSILSVLFFETTLETQLSLDRVYNSFGKYTRYTQPLYLTGFIKSIFVFDSYLKIFTTSFLGSIVFKVLLVVFGKSELTSILERLGLPVTNEDFVVYLEKLDAIGFDKFLVTLLICIFIVNYIIKLFSNKKSSF